MKDNENNVKVRTIGTIKVIPTVLPMQPWHIRQEQSISQPNLMMVM